jgi:uncharacterized protein YkwD
MTKTPGGNDLKILKLCLLIVFLLPCPAGAAQTYEQKLEKKIHALVNTERIKHGLKPFKYSSKLSAIARAHSRDMAGKNYTDHIDKDGLNPSDRAKKAGYNIIKKMKGGKRIGVGENIHESYMEKSENGVITPFLPRVDEAAKRAVDGWMNSPGHRANILNPDYTFAGIGVAISKDKRIKATQMFF